jgi:hypothetical protein
MQMSTQSAHAGQELVPHSKHMKSMAVQSELIEQVCAHIPCDHQHVSPAPQSSALSH